MPKKPDTKGVVENLDLDSATLLNSVREKLGEEYQAAVPKAIKNDLGSIQMIGSIFNLNPELCNKSIDNLLNRLGRVYIFFRTYMHAFGDIKKGELLFGESVESVMWGIVQAIVYDIEDSETTVFKRYSQPLYSVVNYINSEVDYPVTIDENEIRKAFLSYNGWSELIEGKINSAYNSVQYDEFLAIKYLLQCSFIKGLTYNVQIPDISTKANMEQVLTQIKNQSNLMTMYSNRFNASGATTFTPKNEQLFIQDSITNAATDVNVLAQTFNVDYARYMGIQKIIDSFGENDNARLAVLFAKDDNYYQLTDADYEKLSRVSAMLLDRNFLMVVDNTFRLESIRNPKGLYYNNFLHKWTIYGVVPFAQIIAYTTEAPTVVSVAVSPTVATVNRGGSQDFAAVVTGTNNPSQIVNWDVNSNFSVINNKGKLLIGNNETSTQLTVTATSYQDNTKIGSANVQVLQAEQLINE